MKIWIDDERSAPSGYTWCKSVNEAKDLISRPDTIVEVIDLDHDAGIFANQGGDYIKIVDWLVELVNTSNVSPEKFPLAFHTMNPVGRENMRVTAERNGFPIMQSQHSRKRF